MSELDMQLPPGRTCTDCFWFKRTCEWLIQATPDRTVCDWSPSRFVEKEIKKKVTDGTKEKP